MTITVPSFHFCVLATTWERELGTLWSALTWSKQRKRGWHCNYSWNSEWPIRSVSGVLQLLDDNEVFTSAMENVALCECWWRIQSSLEVYWWIVLHRCGIYDAIGLIVDSRVLRLNPVKQAGATVGEINWLQWLSLACWRQIRDWRTHIS